MYGRVCLPGIYAYAPTYIYTAVYSIFTDDIEYQSFPEVERSVELVLSTQDKKICSMYFLF